LVTIAQHDRHFALAQQLVNKGKVSRRQMGQIDAFLRPARRNTV
jgi:hypothetical protein